MRAWRFLLVFAVALTLAVVPGRHVVALQVAPLAHAVVAGTAGATTTDLASDSHAALGHARIGHVPPGHDAGATGLVMVAGCCGVPILPAAVDYRPVAAQVTWSGPTVAASHGTAAAPEPPPPRL